MMNICPLGVPGVRSTTRRVIVRSLLRLGLRSIPMASDRYASEPLHLSWILLSHSSIA